MKSVPMLLIICFLAVGAFLIGTGCEQKPPPERKPPPRVQPPQPPPTPSPFEQWTSWVTKRENKGYKVLTVEKSQDYLNEHNLNISSENVDFVDTKFVRSVILKEPTSIDIEERVRRLEELGDDIITVDHNVNLRVAVIRFNGYSSSPSEQWKSWVADWEKEGYKVLTPERSQQWLDKHPGISIGGDIGFLALIMTPAGAIITADHNGKIRVAVKRNN